jgi:hypothetical protein
LLFAEPGGIGFAFHGADGAKKQNPLTFFFIAALSAAMKKIHPPPRSLRL